MGVPSPGGNRTVKSEERELRRLWEWLLKPSVRAPVLVLVLAGLGIGMVSVVAFDYTMAATNTEKFCTSCHTMADGPFVMLQDTRHYANETGLNASCADCHVPKEFLPKMWRKIQASREVWGAITGIIDTPEKYLAHVGVMKAREIDRLRANDSRECRNCHQIDHMLLAEQTAKARQYHELMVREQKTCIDCHQGIAHMTPEIAAALEQSRQAGNNMRSAGEVD
jgi:cytochrome c-type protein NapC